MCMGVRYIELFPIMLLFPVWVAHLIQPWQYHPGWLGSVLRNSDPVGHLQLAWNLILVVVDPYLLPLLVSLSQ